MVFFVRHPTTFVGCGACARIECVVLGAVGMASDCVRDAVGSADGLVAMA